MTDLELFFLVLAVFYLLQCLVWVPPDAVCFRPGWRGKWRVAPAGLQFAEGGSRGLFTAPFPPLNGLAACEGSLFSISPAGVVAPAAPPRPAVGSPKPAPRQARFAEPGKFSAATNEIHLGKLLFVRTASAPSARHWAELLETLRPMSPERREAELQREFARQLSTDEVTARLNSWRENSFNLRLACNSLFAVLFVLLPFHVWRQIIAHTWPLLGAYYLAHILLIAWLFRRLHRSLYPKESEARWVNTLLIATYPLGAVRALDVVQRDLFNGYHPAAVAAVLCDAATARQVASRTLREVRFPLPESSELEAGFRRETQEWFRAHMGQAFEKFLRKEKAPPEELLQPPARLSESCRAYCPRCCGQFVVVEGTCSDCAGIALVRFPAD